MDIEKDTYVEYTLKLCLVNGVANERSELEELKLFSLEKSLLRYLIFHLIIVEN